MLNCLFDIKIQRKKDLKGYILASSLKMNKDFSGGSEAIYSMELIVMGNPRNMLMKSMITNCKYFTFVITVD